MLKHCARCGEPFEAKRKSDKYCKNTHYAECPICGQKFVVPRSCLHRSVMCCSKSCGAERRKRTSLERYECVAPGNSEAARAKAKQTSLQHFGVPYPMMSKQVQEKSKQTLLDKYGVDNISKYSAANRKAMSTCIQKYGALPIHLNDAHKRYHPTVFDRYSMKSNWRSPAKPETEIIEQKKLELKQLIESHGYTCQLNYDLQGVVYDLYIVDTPYLVEICPTSVYSIYADSSNEVYDMYYHRNRTIYAETAGFQCIHIWDWDDIDKILGAVLKSDVRSLSDVEVYRLNQSTANTFLRENDLKGAIRGDALHLGAISNEEILACISFTKSRHSTKFDVELARCTSKLYTEVPDVFDLLSSTASQVYEITRCISYMDYSKPYLSSCLNQMGMKFDHLVHPTLIYSKGDKFYTQNMIQKQFHVSEIIDDTWLPMYTCGSKVYTF